MYGPQVTGASKASPGKPHRIQTRQKSFFGFGRGEIFEFLYQPSACGGADRQHHSRDRCVASPGAKGG